MDELPGIFNWILEGLRRLIRNGKFTGTDSKKQKALIREFRSANDPMYTYLEEEADNFFDESGEGKEINRSDIFKKYIEWAIEQSRELLDHGAPAIHYYTMAKTDNVCQIVKKVF